mgnify:CR=1 FL=1|jgi:xanthine dehydrogenase accessory factor
MSQLRDWIRARLKAETPIVLAAVTETAGSTARSSDALMALDAEGGLAGTVGGGYVEAQSIEAARRLLNEARSDGGGRALDLDFDLTPETHKTRMICGGRLSVHEALVLPGSPGAKALLACLDEADHGRAAGLVVIPAENEPLALMVDSEDRVRSFGSSTASISVMERLSKSHPAFGIAACLELGEARPQKAFWLSFVPDPVLYIFGAGHVGKALADFACLAGYRVIVTDDRPEMLNRERFPKAEALRLIRDFGDALSESSGAFPVSPGPADSALVLTRRPDIDKSMLAQLLRTGAGYIGLIGSKGKRDGIYEQLRSEGYSDRDLARVHCPVGLPIGARTPEEIAISILAEIIAVCAGIQTGAQNGTASAVPSGAPRKQSQP